MRFFYIVLVVLWLPLTAVAETFDIFGYFEPQYYGFATDGMYYQLQTNKLRVDFEGEVSNRVSFGANVNLINYNGMEEYDILDYLPARVTESIPPDQISSYKIAYHDTVFLDNAYMRIGFQRVDVMVGKQQISYGSGYAWNPTDIFNVKDVLDPTYEQPGQNAIRVDVQLMGELTAMGVYSPGDDFEESKALVRLKTYVSGFDVAVMGAVLNHEKTDYFSFTTSNESRNMYGIDVVGQILGLGVWAEGAYNVMETWDDYMEVLIGVDYTLDNSTYLMGEFYHNSGGRDDYSKYNLNDYMRYFTGESRSMGRDNIFCYVDYPATDLMSVGASVIFCISDATAAMVPQLNYNLFQNVDFTVMGNLFMGKPGTTFSSDLGQGGLARLQIYF